LVPVNANPLLAAGALALTPATWIGALAVVPATVGALATVPALAEVPSTTMWVIGDAYPVPVALAGPANVIAAMITPNVTMRGARRRLLVDMRSP
jgi:hypothetical protein